jgi:hypothetical protein
MTPERVLEVVALYEKRFQDHGVLPLCCREDEAYPLDVPTRNIRYVAWMLGEIRAQVGALEVEKAMRWLGFVQGAIWCYGWYGLDEMRDHNR